MCGCTLRKSKINGIMRKAKFTKPLTQVAMGVAGFALAKQLNRIEFLNANPALGGGAKIALGLFLATQRNPNVASIGLGTALAGGVELTGTLMPALGVSGIAGVFPYNRVAGHGPLVVVE